MRPAGDEFGPDTLARALAPHLSEEGPWSIVIALSGGADSAALLAAAAALAATTPWWGLRALHVDHGLAGAVPLAAAAAAVAMRLGVPLEVCAVTVDDARGGGLEAAARTARYRAFAAQLAPGEYLLTAQHREDQAETLLLQLVRGAGLPGLASMPAAAVLGQGQLLRPLLGTSRRAIRAYAVALDLPFFEDPMNADLRFDRSFLRASVWPLLEARWPAVATTLARSATHAAAAQRVLDAGSAQQLARAGQGALLSVAALREVAGEQRLEMLRYWLRRLGLPVPPTARWQGIEREMLHARPDASPRMAWSGVELRRHAGWLYAFAALPPPVGPERRPMPRVPARLPLAGLGALSVRWVPGAGIAAPEGASSLVIGRRCGGERLRLDPAGPSRPLKDWLREARLPPWARERAMLVFEADRVVAVVLPEVTWVAAERRAGEGERGLVVTWEEAPAALMRPPLIEPGVPFL